MFKSKKHQYFGLGVFFLAIVVVGLIFSGTNEGQPNIDPEALEATISLIEDGFINEMAPYELETEDLEQDESGNFAIDSNGTQVSIPPTSEGMISLSGNEDRENIVMGVATNWNVPGVLVNDNTVLYKDEDFGVGVEAFEGGIRQTFIIDNSDAPAYFVVEFELPENGRLEFATDDDGNTDGSVLLYASDVENDTFGAIDIPWARDKNGEEVPTRFEINGNLLIQHVDHSDDFTYPIVADPTAFSNYFTNSYWQWRDDLGSPLENLNYSELSLSLYPNAAFRVFASATVLNFSAEHVATLAVVQDSWQTVRNRHRNDHQWRHDTRTDTALWEQYVCHVFLVWWRPGSWNLEPRRDAIGMGETASLGENCNPRYQHSRQVGNC